MTTQIHRIAERQPEFPCWVFVNTNLQWYRADKPEMVSTVATHWAPDQPLAPTATPQTEGERAKVPPGYTAEELDRDNPYNAWMHEDAPAPATILSNTGGEHIPIGKPPYAFAPAVAQHTANGTTEEQGETDRIVPQLYLPQSAQSVQSIPRKTNPKRSQTMSDHNERTCTKCGSLTHHEDDCALRVTPTPSPAPQQWAKDAADEIWQHTGIPSSYNGWSRPEQISIFSGFLAAIITKHAAALSEENEWLKGIQSMHDMCVGDLAIALGLQGHESPAEIKKSITTLRQWSEQAREAMRSYVDDLLAAAKAAELQLPEHARKKEDVWEWAEAERITALLQSRPAATNKTEEGKK